MCHNEFGFVSLETCWAVPFQHSGFYKTPKPTCCLEFSTILRPQRCRSWGLIPVSPEAPLVSWHWRPEVTTEVYVPLTAHPITAAISHCGVPWVTWPAVTWPPPESCDAALHMRRQFWEWGAWRESCPSPEGANETTGMSGVLFLLVFLRAGPLQGTHCLLHAVVQNVLHLRRKTRRTLSQLHLAHNNDKVSFYFRTVGPEKWKRLQFSPDTTRRLEQHVHCIPK